MRVLLVEATPDPASGAIAKALHETAQWLETPLRVEGHPIEELDGAKDVSLLRTNRVHLESEPLEAALHAVDVRPEAIVFLSKHKAASGQRALTVHPVGNFTEALYGGKPGQLGPSSPALQSELLRGLARRAKADAYPAQVTFEVTHHGPLLATPSCFIELGSGPEHWQDAAGARVVAEAILEVVMKPLPDYPAAVGLGGGHYAPRFSEAALSQRVHFGHLIPNHAAEAVSDPAGMVRQAVEKSRGAHGAYLHRKSLPKDVLEKWRNALMNAGVEILDSGAWSPLEATP